MTTNQSFSNNIRLYREAIGLTQNDLALKTTIPAPTLRRYEKGETRIPERNKITIADALNQPLESIFPSQPVTAEINRRQFLGMTTAIGTGLSIVGLNPMMLSNPIFQGNRKELRGYSERVVR
jgi:transcriptional regulator with XRE-family HTH domain